jgi:ornithine cyclodeaminase/alanine dehydrogenase-like protein (mu-crystallin family)
VEDATVHLRIIDRALVEEHLTWERVIESQRQCFRALGEGTAILPHRTLMPGPHGSATFCYAAKMDLQAPAVAKFGSVVPANRDRGMPSVSALVLVTDPDTGQPTVAVEGGAITTLRTAGASAVAVQALATPGPVTLAVIGTGVQASAHVRALAHVVDLATVHLVGRDPGRAERPAAALAQELGLDVRPGTAEEAVRAADVVLTATTSTTPVLAEEWVRDGATVVSVGSFAEDRTEVPTSLLARAGSVVVDHRETALDHAGSITAALADGSLRPQDVTDLGQVLVGAAPGRRGAQDVVFYNSVGVGLQDAAAAASLLAHLPDDLGNRVSLIGRPAATHTDPSRQQEQR